jgi:hypothetical protein
LTALYKQWKDDGAFGLGDQGQPIKAGEMFAQFVLRMGIYMFVLRARDIVVIGGDFNSSIGVDPKTTPRTHKSQYHPRGPFGVNYINPSSTRAASVCSDG